MTHQKKNNKNNKTTVPGNNTNYVIYQCNICKTEIPEIADFNKHIKICNLNPMNNPQLMRTSGGLIIGNGNGIQSDHQHNQQQQHNNHNNGVNGLEPKKEVNIEIKTEIDDGSNTHPTPTPTGAPTLITLHTQQHIASNHHQTQNHQVQLNHNPQGQTHHQILTTPNGHIITNFLELTNTNNLHIENLHYGKHH